MVPTALTLAERMKMDPWLIESISPDIDAELASGPGGAPAVDVLETSYVARVGQSLAAAVDWDVLHGRHPADAIVSAAEAWPVGLLALATHRRAGWSRFTVGSVGLQVVHDAPCPVLLV
jgi:nucleotide-binding universal stress UspA family protein